MRIPSHEGKGQVKEREEKNGNSQKKKKKNCQKGRLAAQTVDEFRMSGAW